ncbi:hypothetical protein CIPAW_04G180700 [Carya illinoinensis]|uniref:Uncharacterized protein n=1 Tax=Carya illinoinensis TaxID=32201 RepID=A0A8T1QUI6_CARIL|nr:hypothetical protein CIPAW_04G180700 [Carya illinoinensis]
MTNERTGPRCACHEKLSLNRLQDSPLWSDIVVFQHLILPSMCPLHTTLLPSSPSKHVVGEVDADSRNGAVYSSPVFRSPTPGRYKSPKSQILIPHSLPAHNWESVAVTVLKKLATCDSLSG